MDERTCSEHTPLDDTLEQINGLQDRSRFTDEILSGILSVVLTLAKCS